jgi:hypothetical protein
MSEPTSNPSNIWVIISGIAAIFSAAYAFWSNIIAKKALRIALKEFEDKQANYRVHLNNNYRYTDNNEKKKILLFNVSIENISTLSNTFTSKLEIEYINDNNQIVKIISNHDSKLMKFLPKEYNFFENEFRFEGKDIKSNWLLFEQPYGTFENHRINKYTINVYDTKGNNKSVSSFIIKELINEKD